MTTKEYLESVLDAQTFADDDQEIKDLRQNRDEVKDCLLEVFGSPKPSIKWAGSMSKRTMIRDSYDGDVTCYFEHGDTRQHADPRPAARRLFPGWRAFVAAQRSARIRCQSHLKRPRQGVHRSPCPTSCLRARPERITNDPNAVILLRTID